MNQVRILIVDDSPSMRTLIRTSIEDDYEVQVLEAADGETAEALLQEQNVMMEPVDIVILDWMMPKLSGYGLLKRIRGAGSFFKQPDVIMLTAETYLDQIEACMKFRVAKYITKPFSKAEIQAAIDEILEERGVKRAI